MLSSFFWDRVGKGGKRYLSIVMTSSLYIMQVQGCLVRDYRTSNRRQVSLSEWNLSQNPRKWAQNSIQARHSLHHHILEDKNIKLNNPGLHIRNNLATQFNRAPRQHLQWCINSLMLWWPCSSLMSFQYQWTVLTAKLLLLPLLISHQVLWHGCPAVPQLLLGKCTSRILDIAVLNSYNPRQKFLKHPFSLFKFEMWLKRLLAKTTLEKGGGKKRERNFSTKCFKDFVRLM